MDHGRHPFGSSCLPSAKVQHQGNRFVVSFLHNRHNRQSLSQFNIFYKSPNLSKQSSRDNIWWITKKRLIVFFHYLGPNDLTINPISLVSKLWTNSHLVSNLWLHIQFYYDFVAKLRYFFWIASFWRKIQSIHRWYLMRSTILAVKPVSPVR